MTWQRKTFEAGFGFPPWRLFSPSPRPRTDKPFIGSHALEAGKAWASLRGLVEGRPSASTLREVLRANPALARGGELGHLIAAVRAGSYDPAAALLSEDPSARALLEALRGAYGGPVPAVVSTATSGSDGLGPRVEDPSARGAFERLRELVASDGSVPVRDLLGVDRSLGIVLFGPLG